MLHVNAAILRGLTSFILCLICNVVSENHSVQNSPLGEGGVGGGGGGVYNQLKA